MKIERRALRYGSIAYLLLLSYSYLTVNRSFVKNVKSKQIVVSKDRQTMNKAIDGIGNLPEVTWLMSFPNSGTSYTIYLVSKITNTTTTTNYSFEKMMMASPKPLYPSIHPRGPFFKQDGMNLPQKFSMTKTHCTGYSNDSKIKEYIKNPGQFEKGCATVHLKVNGKTRKLLYDETILPKTAIRLVRDPFDNVVSNYHHWLHNLMKEDDSLVTTYTSDEERFQAYCKRYNLMFERKMDEEQVDLFKDNKMKEMLEGVPCHQFFFRYAKVSIKSFIYQHLKGSYAEIP